MVQAVQRLFALSPVAAVPSREDVPRSGAGRGRRQRGQEGNRIVTRRRRRDRHARQRARALAGGGIGRLLRAAHPGLEISEKIVVTAGDRQQTGPVIDLGGKGVWVKEIEEGLLAGEIDLAVHSMKDVPAALAPGLAIVAVPTRADPRDAIVSRDGSVLAALAPGSRDRHVEPPARVPGPRARADLSVEILRGNVDTRLRKVAEGVVDAAVLASAGLDRLGFSARIAERLDATRMLPAIGQGALAIEARAADARVVKLCRALADAQAEVTTAAERGLLAGLGVGCRTPVAGHATLADGKVDPRRARRASRCIRDDP